MKGTDVENADFIRAQMILLEALFDSNTLRDPRQRHPVAARWQLCLQLLRQGGVVRWPEQKDELPLLAKILLDSTSFVSITSGRLDSLTLGALNGYGDAAVQRKIATRLNDPAQFEDLMVEISIAAWHQMEGHVVTPSEAPGWADLKVDVPSLEFPLLIECKRLNTMSALRLGKDIAKANKQIKHVAIPAYGTVFLDISNVVPQSDSLSDAVPPEVRSIVEAAKAALRGPKNRSVGRAIVVWDDVGILGDPPDRVAICFRRHFTNVDHGPDPDVRILPPQSTATFHGSTVMVALEWDTSAVGIDQIMPSDLMKECRKWFNFSDDELIEAFRNRNKWQPLSFGDDERLFLFTRVSDYGGKHTLILAFAGRTDRALVLQCALRLPEQYVDRTDLLTPLEILELVASDYGLEVTLGDLTRRFLMRHQFVLQDNEGGAPLVIIHNPSDHAVLQSMMVKLVPVEAGLAADCALVFALDRTKLIADLEA